MKLRKRDHIFTAWDMFFGRRLKRLFVRSRYIIELGGTGGYEINGAPKYWGRYGTPEKIVELVSNFTDKDDWISYDLPAAQYDFQFSHTINIWASSISNEVRVEFLYSSDQCGSYEKCVLISKLLEEVKNLPEYQNEITDHGYVYAEY